MTVAAILNISAYRFVALADLPALRQRLFDSAAHLQIKGTILLAEEGINLALAGPDAALRPWLAQLQADPRFADLPLKQSHSATLPFKRLKVKCKREIIRMNQPVIQPSVARAPAVSAHTLARWLQAGCDDAGHPLLLLDTRNAFEVDAGGFVGALDWRLQQFSDFPAALVAQRAALEGHTVVSYCTGGIRCEKAALLMQQAGLARSYQLDGGILKYFEDTAGAAPGWHGRCVVFDERQTLGADLQAG